MALDSIILRYHCQLCALKG